MSEEQTNPLFAAFTDHEKKAVAELKTKLPEILNAAQAPPNYALWGIALDKDSTDERLGVILIKFLRARKFDLPATQEMLVAAIQWRIQFKADSILSEETDSEIYPPYIGFIHGKDTKGRPVTYNLYGGLDNQKVFGDLQRFMRWRVQLMERGIQLLDFKTTDSLIQVHDYQNVNMFSYDKTVKAASKKVTQTMQNNYPEFLAVKFFINVPYWGDLIFKIISVFMPEETKKKLIITSAGNVKANLTSFISEEQLPVRYGGKSVVEELKALEVREQKKTRRGYYFDFGNYE